MLDMLITNNIQPGVYNIVETSIKGKHIYNLEFKSNMFTTPNKLYGNTNKNAIRIWNTFAYGKTSTGVILLGEAGSGKTTFAEVLGNIAISKGIAVILCINIVFTPELIHYISSLDNVVLLLDEFGKNVSMLSQNKTLTMFSDSSKKRLYIITENTESSVSRYIINRPGRIKYRLDYNKVDKDTLEDYIADNKITSNFKEELLLLWSRSTIFTFDHLQALVTEHIMYPNDTIEDLLNILNLSILKRDIVYIIYKVTDLEDNILHFSNRRTEWDYPIPVDIKSILDRYSPYGIEIWIKDNIVKEDNSVININTLQYPPTFALHTEQLTTTVEADEESNGYIVLAEKYKIYIKPKD